MVVLIAKIEGNCFYIIFSILLVWRRSDLLNLSLLAVDFEQVIISVFFFFFTVLFANQIMICSTLAAHVPSVLSCLLNLSSLAADFEQVIFPVICFLVICFLPCLLTKYLFISCKQHMCHGFPILCIHVVLADVEQVIVLVLLYLVLFVN